VAIREAPPAPERLLSDVLLDGLAAMVTEGRASAAPQLRPAIEPFLEGDLDTADWIRLGARAALAAFALWDFDSWARLSSRHLEMARRSGALGRLCIALNSQAIMTIWRGELDGATSLLAELNAVAEATGTRIASYEQLLGAYRGTVATDPRRVPSDRELVERGNGLATEIGDWATAVLSNGRGRYADAYVAALAAAHESAGPSVAPFALCEMIEGAARNGRPRDAESALARFSALTVPESDWAGGLEARGRALVSTGAVAEACYAESIDRLDRSALQLEVARSRLLFGE
jgi:hypothetical protein